MPIQKSAPKSSKVLIDLDGPNGNVFVIMSTLSSLMKQLNFSGGFIKSAIEQMRTASCYEASLAIACHYGGEFLVLETLDDTLMQKVNREYEILLEELDGAA